jgi:hypothetical protein
MYLSYGIPFCANRFRFVSCDLLFVAASLLLLSRNNMFLYDGLLFGAACVAFAAAAYKYVCTDERVAAYLFMLTAGCFITIAGEA